MLLKTNFEQFIEKNIKSFKNNNVNTLEDIKQLLGADMFTILDAYYLMSPNKQKYIKDTIDNLKKHQL